MPIRTILLPVTPGDDMQRRLDAVLPLARSLEAHLDVLLLSAEPAETLAFAASGMMANGSMLAMLQDDIEQSDRAMQAQLATWRATNGVPPGLQDGSVRTTCATFTHRVGTPDHLMAEAGRLADLIVLDRPSGHLGWNSAVTDVAVFDTGRPVLFIPPGPLPLIPMLDRIAVAWNGSLEATRAVTGALPLLHKADDVVVLASEIDRGLGRHDTSKRDTWGAGLCRSLEFHGVRAARRPFVSHNEDNETIGAALLRQVHEQRASLLVMGAYTHSRVRQYLLGGATGHVFAHADLPLLVAH